MRFVILLLLLVAHTWAVYLPPAQLGKPYSARITSQKLSECAVDDTAKTSGGMAHGVPPGLSVAADGVVLGEPKGEAISYQFVTVCSEARFTATIKVIN